MKFKRIATIDGLAIEDILTYDIINIIQIKKRYYHHVRKYDKLIEIDKELVNYVDSGDMRKKFDSKVIPVEKIIKNALKPDKVN